MLTDYVNLPMYNTKPVILMITGKRTKTANNATRKVQVKVSYINSYTTIIIDLHTCVRIFLRSYMPAQV